MPRESVHTRLVEPVSPELALVDPELAARAREVLPVPPPTPPALPEPPRLRLILSERLIPRDSAEPVARTRRARPHLAAAVVAAAIGLAGAAWLPPSREAAPERRVAPAAPAADPLAPAQFTWAPAAEARTYLFVLYRRGRPVYEASTSVPRLVLPLRWSFGGEPQRLRGGTYRWVVVPRYGAIDSLREGDPIVDALYTV